MEWGAVMTSAFPMPRINLNGTSVHELKREYLVAYDRLVALEAALRSITIHDRDYHLISRTAGSEARQRRQDWLLALNAIQQDISDVVLSIDQQGNRS